MRQSGGRCRGVRARGPRSSAKRLRRAAWTSVVVVVVATAGCAGDGANQYNGSQAQQDQPLYSDVRLFGPLNGVEWQVDAPWRIEPGAATTGHAKIPISITFHDVRDQDTIDRIPYPFGSICGLYIVEDPQTVGASPPVTAIAPTQFHEIEASRRWTLDGALTGGANAHVLRRIWNHESPSDVVTISDWTDWNATAFYEPRQQTPGADVKLIAMVRVSRSGPCSAQPLTQNEVLLQLTRGRESDRAAAAITPTGRSWAPQSKRRTVFLRRFPDRPSGRGRVT